jgi:hypothetical protein
MYPEQVPFPVYDHDEWYADDWDPLSYGQSIDPSRSFFEQFKELRNRIPRISLVSDKLCVNSPYVNSVFAVKNSHLLFASAIDEDCYYGYRIIDSKQCVDNLFTHTCELCYECINAYSSYNCKYSQHIGSCTDSAFLYDCNGCIDCLFCVGLRNKSYCIFNVQYSKEEYAKKLSGYRFESHEAVEKMKEELAELILKFPRRFAAIKNSEHVSGDNINSAKNCVAVFDIVNAENVSYGQFINDARDSMDVNYEFDHVELHYEVIVSGPQAYFVRFSADIWPNVSNLDYCDSGANISDCFGCVGLRNKQYCILNKQYSKDEYESRKAKLIAHMKETGEWGEFFPVELSPFAYNESTAMIFFPMTKESVAANGWRWQDDMPGSFGKETSKISDIPDSINDVTESVINEIFACGACEKNYKITKQEYAFYKQCVIPIPRKCFDCRMASRIAQRNSTQLHQRQCMCDRSGHDHADRCQIEFKTTYAPERTEIIYCEQCYQKEVV